jgi:hypothetical protein
MIQIITNSFKRIRSFQETLNRIQQIKHYYNFSKAVNTTQLSVIFGSLNLINYQIYLVLENNIWS